MKTASAALIALLASSNEFFITETYTFTLADGSTLTWTMGDSAAGTGYSVDTAAEDQADLLP